MGEKFISTSEIFDASIMQLIEDFRDEQSHQIKLVPMAIRGMRFVEGNPERMTILQKYRTQEEDSGTSFEEEYREAVDSAKLAQSEYEAGYPFLHTQSILSQWSSLESFIRRLGAEWIKLNPDVLKSRFFEKVKVKVSDLHKTPESERPFFFVEQLEYESRGPDQVGFGKFEALLKHLDLPPMEDSEDKMKRDMFEYSQVRNLLTHKSGVVDRRFCEACPWMGVTIGEKIQISRQIWLRYSMAIADYHCELVQRLRVRYGHSRWPDPNTGQDTSAG